MRRTIHLRHTDDEGEVRVGELVAVLLGPARAPWEETAFAIDASRPECSNDTVRH